jgi:hypothetical protein
MPPTKLQLISEFLASADEGDVDPRAAKLLSEVSAAVDDTGKPGELVIKIKVRKEGKHAAVKVELSAKRPQAPHREEPFYFTEDGTLSREDTRQLTLDKIATPRLVNPS